MKKVKLFELSDFPDEFQDEITEKFWHCNKGVVSWYPGDGYFKPLSEVKDMSKIMFFDGDNIDTPNVYVYEKGDDKIGDFLMDNFKIKLCEDVKIAK